MKTALLLLALAIVCEVTATSALKASHGLSRLGPSLIVAVGYLGAFTLLAFVLETLPVGWTYAVWSGCGTVGAVLIGCWLYAERLSPRQGVGIALVVLGVALLHRPAVEDAPAEAGAIVAPRAD